MSRPLKVERQKREAEAAKLQKQEEMEWRRVNLLRKAKGKEEQSLEDWRKEKKSECIQRLFCYDIVRFSCPWCCICPNFSFYGGLFRCLKVISLGVVERDVYGLMKIIRFLRVWEESVLRRGRTICP